MSLTVYDMLQGSKILAFHGGHEIFCFRICVIIRRPPINADTNHYCWTIFTGEITLKTIGGGVDFGQRAVLTAAQLKMKWRDIEAGKGRR